MPLPRRQRNTAAHVLLLLLALVLGSYDRALAQRQPLDGLGEYIDGAMKQWRIPGLAIAVVKDDSVVFMRGFGVRRLGDTARVDENTSFANASTTKAFTTTALAMLVDEGKLRWDDRVTRLLPGFELSDPWVTRELRVRDLVTHRTGLAAADLLWYAADASSDDIVRRVRFQPPATSFRSRYEYNNNMFLVAGKVVEAASGIPWGEFVRRRILEPLGMTSTVTGLAGLQGRADVAQPHLEIHDTIRAFPYLDLDDIAPAGAMNSTVADMARWIRFHLDSARIGNRPAAPDRPDRRLVSDSAWRELFTPQTVIRAEDYYPQAAAAGAHFRAYGMGWFLQDYRGRKLAMHTGSIDGMSALVALLPEERLGLVVFANLDHAELRHALMYRVLDAYTSPPGTALRDWSAEFLATYRAGQAREAEASAARLRQRVPGARAALPLSAYEGTFADSLYGTVLIRAEGKTLVLSHGTRWTADLAPWGYDTFLATWRDPRLGDTMTTFVAGPGGTIAAVRLQGMTEFRRVRPPAK